MSAFTPSRNAAPVTHPVVLLARTIAAILGILAVLAHLPGLGVVLAALAGYGAALVLFRRSWNGTTDPAA